MTNINLHQTMDSTQEKSSFLGGGMFISLTVLVVVFLLYGGLKMYNQYSFLDKIEEVEAETVSINTALKGGAVEEVHDFNLRLEALVQDVDAYYAANYMRDAASIVHGGVILEGFVYDRASKTAIFNGTADTMGVMAQQLYHLKTSETFEDITLSALSLDEEGKMAFEISAPVAK